jgi:hypothetical protein
MQSLELHGTISVIGSLDFTANKPAVLIAGFTSPHLAHNQEPHHHSVTGLFSDHLAQLAYAS